LRATDIHVEVDGPTIVRSHAFRTHRSTIEQRIVLEAGSDLVRIETTVDWHERHRMLRTEFRPTHFGPTALSEIQFGHIARPTTEHDPTERAQFETCAHKWIATQDASGGFALLNDSKYGHRAKNGLLSINLLRSPTFPDKTADRGIHRFTYAFRAFTGGDLTPVIRDGYRLNNPLIPVGTHVLESAASTSDPGIVIETIKPAENGHGVVLRLYESLGREATTAVDTRFAHDAVAETNLMEEPIAPADLGHLAFDPFEIKTILLETTP
jgi:alpha-mannosidase